MDTTQALAIVGVVLGVVGTIVGAINHKRLRSNCFGKEIVVSMDLEATTPPSPKLTIKVPSDEKKSGAT
jgi:hypothetical protein